MDDSAVQTSSQSSYMDPLKCARCYSKHLSKAAVEYQEFLEDPSRFAELSLAVGDVGCAEDHAQALGRQADRDALRAARGRMLMADQSVRSELLSMAAAAVSEVARRPSVPSRPARADGSNG